MCFNKKCDLEVLIGPLELLDVPDLHLVVDVVIVIVDALRVLAKVRGPDPATLAHTVRMELHGPLINDLENFARVKILTWENASFLQASLFVGPSCHLEGNEQRPSSRSMHTRPSATLALLAPTVNVSVNMSVLGSLVDI